MKTLSFTKFSVAATCCGILFSACSDDVSKVYKEDDFGVDIAASVDSLGDCDSTNYGKTVFVTDKNSAYVCAASGWVSLTPYTKNVTCSVNSLSDGSGFKVLCDGDSVGVIKNGANGTDGKNGTNGTNGANGKAGADGTDGSDGTYCTIETLVDNLGYNVLCDGDTMGVVWNGVSGNDGEDGTGCSIKPFENGNGYDIYCDGELSGSIVNGADGAKGDQGAAGTYCSVKETSAGYDIYCNGEFSGAILNGADGQDGAAGDSGKSCKISANSAGTGYDVICGKDTVGSLLNGAKGDSGETGAKGASGESCGIIANSAGTGYDVICGSDTVGSLLSGSKGAKGDQGADGTYCTVKETSAGYDIYCNGELSGSILNGDDGQDGAAGDSGKSCRISANAAGTGYDVICGKDTVGSLLNGAKGDSGETGAKGEDGANCKISENADGTGFEVTCGDETVGILHGTNGSNGTSCTVEENAAGGYNFVCGGEVVGSVADGAPGATGDTGETGAVGDSGKSCYVEELENAKGYNVICGADTVGFLNGAKGATGDQGAVGDTGKVGEQGASCTLADNGDGSVTMTCGSETVTLYKALCGGTGIDLATQFCYDGTLYSLCGGKSYSPKKSFCHSETIYDLCNGQVYNPDEMTCESGAVTGEFTDPRDSQTYKTVQIGTQTWFAENLNYAYLGKTADLDSSSFCYKNTDSNCETYGRLYTWSAAMDSAGVANEDVAGTGCGYDVECSVTGKVQGVCPTGWHLPDSTEFETLMKYVANNTTGGTDSVGYALKATSGWNTYNGSDAFGFSALPAGAYGLSSYYYLTTVSFLWTSTEKSTTDAYFLRMSELNDPEKAAIFAENVSNYYFPVRCLKD